MKNVISISLGASNQDFSFKAELLGERLTVRRLGTDGSLAKAEKLVRQWDGKADAIGLGVAKDGNGGGWPRRQAQDAVRLASRVEASPVTTGERLGEIFLEWAARHTQIALGQYFNNAKVLFFSGIANQKLAASMAGCAMGDLAREMIRNRFKYIGEFEKCRNHNHERGMATYLKILRNIEKSLRENTMKDRLVLHYQIPEELEARLVKVEL